MSRRTIISSCRSSKVTSSSPAGSSCSPAKTSRNMSATRRGVPARHSRSGSSPTAFSRSRTARSTASLSCMRGLQADDLVQDGVGHVALRQERQVDLEAVAAEDGHLVLLGGEAAARQRDVVGDDQIEPLALELAARVLDQVLALRGEADPDKVGPAAAD